MTHLETLGRWSAALAYDAIPPSVRRAARVQVLDMIAAVHAAARSHETTPVLDGVRAFAGGGRATVLATGERYAPCDAAMANAACSMAQDFDDIVWMGHTCHSAVFAPLAVAEQEGADGRALVTAIVVANEIGGRIGASSFLGPLNGQMWTFIHLVGAAAATAKILGLDGERTTHALAIALAQPTFALQPGFLRPTSKLLAAATPTATGMQAAYFARAGMTGAPGILEDRRGFWRRFSYLPMPGMLGRLGEHWTLDTLQIKTFPGCHYFQTALTAIERLRARCGTTDVARVTIDTTKLACEATRFAQEYATEDGAPTPVGVNFDLAQSAAVLLHAGRLGVAELDARYLRDNADALAAWVARIDVRHDPALTARVIAGARGLPTGREAIRAVRVRDLLELRKRYAEDYRSTLFSLKDAGASIRGVLRRRARGARASDGVPLFFPARVTFELRDGRRDTEEIDLPVGAVASGDVEREIAVKLEREATPVIGAERARALLDAKLDELAPSDLARTAARARD